MGILITFYMQETLTHYVTFYSQTQKSLQTVYQNTQKAQNTHLWSKIKENTWVVIWARIAFSTWLFLFATRNIPSSLMSSFAFCRCIKWQLRWKSNRVQITNTMCAAGGQNCLHKESWGTKWISIYSAFYLQSQLTKTRRKKQKLRL